MTDEEILKLFGLDPREVTTRDVQYLRSILTNDYKITPSEEFNKKGVKHVGRGGLLMPKGEKLGSNNIPI